jgi:creatinine amidohydrolase
MNAAPFPLYRDRYLPAMTPNRIAALPDKAWAPVILATGAVEQHGPHLPVSVDAFLGQLWLSLILSQLPAGVSCYAAPPITIGKSNEHVGFPGTLMISKGTLRELVLAVARQVKAWGFQQLALLNTHGGNISVLHYTLREVRETYGLRADFLRGNADLGLSTQESTYGFHAGELETSWMLAAAGPLVKMAGARCEYPARLEDPGLLRPEAAPATYSWATQDVSKSGIMGDATVATEDKGRRWAEQATRRYLEQVAELCRVGKAGGPSGGPFPRHAPA